MIRTAIKFGAFVAVCMGFTVYLAFTIGNISINDPFGHDYYSLNATFDDVTGLLPADNVKIAGVVVGKVTKISVVEGKAKVTFDVKKSIALGPDTSAAIRWRNLIGQRYLYLYPGQDHTTKLTNGQAVKSTQSVVDLGELFNRLGPIIASIDPHMVNDFLDTVSQALDGNQDKLGNAIDDLATLAKGLSTRDETIGHLITNLNTVTATITDRDQQIRVMLDNLVLLASTFSANTGTLDNALTEFSQFSGNLQTILGNNTAEIDQIINNLDLVTGEVVSPRLSELDHALKGIDTMATKVFASSRLGQWLNQTILCAAQGAPSSGGQCNSPLNGTPSAPGAAASSGGGGASPNGQATPGAPAPPVDIGSRAASQAAGVSALTNLLQSASGAGP